VIFDVKPAMVGHRGFGAGGSGPYPENSVEAFLAAVACGVFWVELDARRSSDGELVVWHDPVTPAGHRVVTRTAAELGAERIVRLAEVLAALPAGVGVNIDVKTVLEDATEQQHGRTHARVADALRDHRGTRPFLVSSFDPSVPVYLAGRTALAGEAALGLITSENLAPGIGIAAAANLGLDAACVYSGTLHLDADDHSPGRGSAARAAEFAHDAGVEVMTWTPTPAQAARAAVAGVETGGVDDIPGTQAALAAVMALADAAQAYSASAGDATMR
jgi:glycerophosphoryl diester phosphodiesterase